MGTEGVGDLDTVWSGVQVPGAGRREGPRSGKLLRIFFFNNFFLAVLGRHGFAQVFL